jgi:septal ring factor EnvC (AmiA/AmiB activator)
MNTTSDSLSKKLSLTIIVAFLCMLSISSYARNTNNIPNKKAELHHITSQIEQLKKMLNQAKHTETNLHSALNKNEKALGTITSRLGQLNNQLNKQMSTLKDLENKQTVFETHINQQRETLSQQMRATYLLSRNQYMKMLLTQDDPAMVSRSLIYYRYLNRARLNFITRLDQTLYNLQLSQEQLEQNTTTLQKLRSQQQIERTQLVNNQRTSQQRLQEVTATIQTKSQKLQALLANKRALETILSQIRITSPSFNPPPSNIAFARLQGRLPWPTLGTLSKRFGVSIEQSELKSSGVFLQAKTGEPVKSIYQGQVVFANWLKGFGQLIIVDHGGGYMSLYGHNQNLAKKVGETVSPGDTLAWVGSSENDESGLYFEIRQNGRPTNPENWCANKGQNRV